MKPLKPADPETKSMDVLAENISALKALLPEIVVEGKIDFDALKDLLGGEVDEREEKYGLNWHGKRRARQLALTPSTGTLRPCPAESVDWDTTKNLMIEGDNLEVLKLLQKSYAGKVKLIYIDPPYNTGKDFVYPDNFQNNIKNYLELTGQVEGGSKITSNTEASGRFHTDWLNMMYPRLRLARNLMTSNGLLFVSIDDNEAGHLRVALDELFGAENFLAQIIWQKLYSGKADATHFGTFHEYLLCYARDAAAADVRLLPRTDAMNERYSNPDNDPRGPWLSNDLTAAGERSAGHFDVLSPAGRAFDSPPGKHWLYNQDRLNTLVRDNRIYFGKDASAFPRLKRFLSEVQQGRRANTVWLHGEVGHTDEGTKELKRLFPEGIEFQAPKPTRLIRQILSLSVDPEQDEVVLDFFAGTGSTAEAVLQANAEQNGKTRFVTVQLPEPLDDADGDQTTTIGLCDKLGVARNISELTKERVRRAARKIKAESPMVTGDFGFRVFKLDSTNIRPWDPDRDDLEGTLLDSVNHLKGERTEQDVLFELLLKLGLDLAVPIETKEIGGYEVHSIGAGALIVCLAPEVKQDAVEELALGIATWHKTQKPAGESTVVFRDSAFPDDVAKTNLTAILQQQGFDEKNVRSL